MKYLFSVACVFLFMAAFVMVSCSKPRVDAEEPIPDVSVLARAMKYELTQIDSIMTGETAANNFEFEEEAQIRRLLKAVSLSHPTILTACYVDTAGILKYLEPDKYKKSEGADISRQPHTIAMLTDHKPLISTSFKTVEGFPAIILGHPLFDAADDFVGSLVVTVDTSMLPQMVLENNHIPGNYELWAMEPNGMIVCDQDTEEIALNIFTDELYKPHGSLRILAGIIAKNRKGEGKYSFTATGTDTMVEKKAYWDTIDMADREWRVVLVKVE